MSRGLSGAGTFLMQTKGAVAGTVSKRKRGPTSFARTLERGGESRLSTNLFGRRLSAAPDPQQAEGQTAGQLYSGWVTGRILWFCNFGIS